MRRDLTDIMQAALTAYLPLLGDDAERETAERYLDRLEAVARHRVRKQLVVSTPIGEKQSGVWRTWTEAQDATVVDFEDRLIRKRLAAASHVLHHRVNEFGDAVYDID